MYGAASTFCPNSVLPFPSFDRPNSAISIFSPKDGFSTFSGQRCCPRLAVSCTGSDRDRQGGRPRKGRASGGSSKDGKNETPALDDSTSSGSSNQDDIIALFRRIQSSISKGESVNNNKSSKLLEGRSSVESVLEVLRQSRREASNKDADESFRKKKPTSKNIEKIQREPYALDFKKTRPPSYFVKRSPIPHPTPPRGRVFEQRIETSSTEVNNEKKPIGTDESDDHFAVEGGEESTGLDAMKLPELKEVAKLRGIKGYSKMKKGELLDLLKAKV